MKKLLFPLMTIGLSLSLVACSDDDTALKLESEEETITVDVDFAADVRNFVEEELKDLEKYTVENNGFERGDGFYFQSFRLNRASAIVGNSERVTMNNQSDILNMIESCQNSLESISDEKIVQNNDAYDDSHGLYKAIVMQEIYGLINNLDIDVWDNPVESFINAVSNGKSETEVREAFSRAELELDSKEERLLEMELRVTSKEIEDLIAEESDEISTIISGFISLVKDQQSILSMLVEYQGEDFAEVMASRLVENKDMYERSLERLEDYEDSLGIDDEVKMMYGISTL